MQEGDRTATFAAKHRKKVARGYVVAFIAIIMLVGCEYIASLPDERTYLMLERHANSYLDRFDHKCEQLSVGRNAGYLHPRDTNSSQRVSIRYRCSGLEEVRRLADYDNLAYDEGREIYLRIEDEDSYSFFESSDSTDWPYPDNQIVVTAQYYFAPRTLGEWMTAWMQE